MKDNSNIFQTRTSSIQQTASRVSLIEKVPTNDRFLEKKLKSIVFDDRREHLKKMMEQQQEELIQKGIIVRKD